MDEEETAQWKPLGSVVYHGDMAITYTVHHSVEYAYRMCVPVAGFYLVNGELRRMEAGETFTAPDTKPE